MGGANGSRECAHDDKLRDTHQLHFVEVMGFAGAQPILRIDDKTGSSDLPVGRFVDRRVESSLQKYFAFHSPQIISRTFRIPSHKRGVS